MTDLLRLVVLYEEGGVYLDTDVLVVRSLAPLGNVLGYQDSHHVNGAVLKFERRSEYLRACIQEFLATYDPTKWGFNGPGLLTRVLAQPRFRANQTLVTALPMPVFYPFAEGSRIIRKCFTATNASAKNLQVIVRSAYTVHLNGKWSSETKAQNGSVCHTLLSQNRLARCGGEGGSSS